MSVTEKIKNNLMLKLIIIFVIISTFPIIIIGTISYYSSKEAIKNKIFDSYTAIVESREKAVLLYVKNKIDRVIEFADDGYIINKLNQRRIYNNELNQYLHKNKMPHDMEIYEIFIMNNKGIIIASTDSSVIGRDRSNDDYFVGGKKGAHFKDIYYSKDTKRNAFAISAPIKDLKTGKFLGVIVNRYELTKFNEIVSNRQGLGKTGECYVVNKNNLMITESRFVKNNILKQKVNSKPVKNYNEQNINYVGKYKDYRNEMVVGAAVADEINKYIDLGWIIIVEINEDEAFASSAELGRLIIFITIIILASVIILAYFIAKGIAHPIKRISNQVENVAKGNLKFIKIDIRRGDEVGKLIDSFNTMLENLNNQIKETREAANVLATSTNEISATISQLSTSTSETATAVNETTTTVEEVKQTIIISSERANSVSTRAKDTERISQDGEKSVEDTTDGMSLIKDHMELIAENIVRLSEQSQEIGKIITTVDDIAEQSNLLAVNAAIEATKAGEQGKGFSVVAGEIKNLAEQSKKATEQVREILDEIMKSTSTAVMSTEQGSKAVDKGVELSQKSGDSIRILTNSIKDSAQEASQILTSSREQTTGVEQVSIAMNNIDKAAKQNLDGTKQLEMAAINLKELGNNLKMLVAWYKI